MRVLKMTLSFLAIPVLFANLVSAQSDQVAAIKQSMAANKQKQARYTWQQTETISVNGEVKDTKTYQVKIGPDGQPQKNLLNDQKASSGGGGRRQGRVKERVIEKKTEEFQQYGQQVSALAKQYTHPNPDLLMQAKQQGNITIQPTANGLVNLVIKSFVKPNDSVTMTISAESKQLTSLQVASYLNDPSDAVNISANFTQLPDGTNMNATASVNGVSKKLNVNIQNSNFQPLQ